MKLFLALAFVAVAAALPEPIRLPEAVLPQVADQKDSEIHAVRFVDSFQSEVAPEAEEIRVDAVKFVDYFQSEVAPQAEEIQVDAVKFVDSIQSEVAPQAEEIQVDAVKFVDTPEPEVAAENPRIDAVKVVHVPLEAEAFVQPMEAVAEEIPADAVKIADAPLEVQYAAPVAEEILADPVRFVEAPLEEVSPQAEEIEVDAVRIVDAPAQDEIKIAREPEFVVPAPVVLPSAALPVVAQEIQDGVWIVDAPQGAIVSPVFFQPAMPLIDASPMIVPQQIMDIIIAEQARFDAEGQALPIPGHIFVDPMLR